MRAGKGGLGRFGLVSGRFDDKIFIEGYLGSIRLRNESENNQL